MNPHDIKSVRLYVLASSGEAYVRFGGEDLYMLADDFLDDGGPTNAASEILEDDEDTLVYIMTYRREEWDRLADEVAAGITL